MKKLLITLVCFQIINIIAFISFPVIWILISFDLAWKISLSGFILIIIFKSIYKIIFKHMIQKKK